MIRIDFKDKVVLVDELAEIVFFQDTFLNPSFSFNDIKVTNNTTRLDNLMRKFIFKNLLIRYYYFKCIKKYKCKRSFLNSSRNI